MRNQQRGTYQLDPAWMVEPFINGDITHDDHPVSCGRAGDQPAILAIYAPSRARCICGSIYGNPQWVQD